MKSKRAVETESVRLWKIELSEMSEKRIGNMRYDSRVRFYNTHEEYMEVYNKNQINEQDIIFIDDIMEVD